MGGGGSAGGSDAERQLAASYAAKLSLMRSALHIVPRPLAIMYSAYVQVTVTAMELVTNPLG